MVTQILPGLGILLCLLAVALRRHSCQKEEEEEEEEVPPGLEPISNKRSVSPPEGWGHHTAPSCPSPPLTSGTKPTQGCRRPCCPPPAPAVGARKELLPPLPMDKEGQSLEEQWGGMWTPTKHRRGRDIQGLCREGDGGGKRGEGLGRRGRRAPGGAAGPWKAPS